MYRRMISGMLAVAMTFQMCAGTVHAAGNAKQVTSQPAGTELFVMQEQAEEMAAVESAADFMPETSTETNKETSAEENTEGNCWSRDYFYQRERVFCKGGNSLWTLPLRRARRSQPPSVRYKQRTARRRRMRREILISCFRRAAFR